MTTDDTHDVTAVIEAALADYGQGIHHGRPLAEHIAHALHEEGEKGTTTTPETLHEWSDDLAGTWAEDPLGAIVLLLDGENVSIDVWDTGDKDTHGWLAYELTPRPDLAPVGLKPRPVEGDA